MHTENDATYMVISVPNQEDDVKKNKARQYIFLFKLRNKKNICFKLQSGITFVYSGKLLTHHQTCNLPCLPKEYLFLTLDLTELSVYTEIFGPHLIAIHQRNNY